MRKRTSTLVLGAATLAMVAAACGSSSKSSSGATTTAGGATTAAPATTAGAATTAAGGASTTAGGTGQTLQVDTSKCPAEATTAYKSGDTLKIGWTGPQSGALAAFGAIPQGMQVEFDKLNAAGGIGGVMVQVDPKDDAYDPTKTPAAVSELIDQDKIAASAIQVGTPNVAATQKLFEDSCTPQLFVGSGFPAWGDPAHHPWTVGGILAYNTEAKMWGEFLAKKKPGAKVAQLVYNNDFGKSYQTAFEQVAKDKGFQIVETQLHEGTATSIDNQVSAILAANPDVVIGETTGKYCPLLMAGLAQGGYKGITIVSATCAAVSSFFKPVDPAGNGVYVLGQQKDPSDPRFTADPAMVQYKADVTQYGKGADANNGNIATGYNIGALMVDVLQRAAQLPGGLTRANIMDAGWATDFAVPLVIGGKAKIDGIKDAYTSEYTEMLQYDATKKSQVPTGDTFDVEGQTGVYQGG